jgi:hypothetical protein
MTTSVGRPAPDIEGPDASGRPLSLRDHRGRVVVVAVSPAGDDLLLRQLRDLQARAQKEPLAVLGVSTDPKEADLDAAIKAGAITWPCWWDGAGGPILAGLKGQRDRSCLVIDAEGLIRARGLRGEYLDTVVDRLLAERKARR